MRTTLKKKADNDVFEGEKPDFYRRDRIKSKQIKCLCNHAII